MIGKVRRFITLICTFAMAVTFATPPYAVSAGRDLSDDPNAPIKFIVTPNGKDTEIRSIETRVVETNASDESILELQLSQIIDGDEIAHVTIVVPDDESALPKSFYARASQIAAKVPGAVKNRAVLSSEKFGEWFDLKRNRLAIIAFEVTLMSGLKMTDLMITSAPGQFAPALTASLLIGSIIGYVEYHTPYLVNLYTQHNGFMKGLIEKLNANAHHKLAGAVDSTWWMVKNASLNTFLYALFKIILYSSMKADGSIFERVVDGSRMITPFDGAMFFALGFGATIAGMPTSKLIVQYKNRLVEEAAGDPAKLHRADDIMTFWWSTALTARAAAFSSLLIGYTFEWPGLMIGAAAAIAGMSGGSEILKRRNEAKNKCEEHLAPTANPKDAA